MINTLSILIPTYNNVCVELVKSLQAQASLLYSSSDSLSSSSHFEYEILVADDGSTDERTIEGNRIINTLPPLPLHREKRECGQDCHPQLPDKGGEIYLAAFYRQQHERNQPSVSCQLSKRKRKRCGLWRISDKTRC